MARIYAGHYSYWYMAEAGSKGGPASARAAATQEGYCSRPAMRAVVFSRAHVMMTSPRILSWKPAMQ